MSIVGNQTPFDWAKAKRETFNNFLWFFSIFLASHLGTDLSEKKNDIKPTPNSVSFWVTNSGFPDFVIAMQISETTLGR